jgi:2-amino-4-hydroxy-6-hydroxymethyldihydropteridine diphosphokinase
VLSIGGNIGNIRRRFNKLFLKFKQDNKFVILQTTPLLENPPFGYIKQDDFINGLIVVKTNLSPMRLLNTIWQYEKRFKRARSFKNAPRTLDIDIVFYDTIKINSTKLTIPHKNWQNRQSITILMEYLK